MKKPTNLVFVIACIVLLILAGAVYLHVSDRTDADLLARGFAASRGDAMEERKGLVTMKGNPVTLVGPTLQEGDLAPDFESLQNDLTPVRFSSFRGKICILVSVPSLDTPVCDREAHRFNEEAGKLGPNVVVLTISMDLPFAQKRWCSAAGAVNVKTLSDHRDASFGRAYGVLIEGLRLLARAVFVVDREGKLRRVELVKEIASEPDYDATLKTVRGLL